MPFEPIAIIGQSCVLPGALTPEDLWRAVLEGRDLVSSAPEGYWRVDPRLVLATDPQQSDDHTWTDRGGYVRGFESVFDPQGFAIPADQILTLDPLFHWVLHGGREALRGAGHLDRPGLHSAGAILGNLSYPSTSLSRLAESVWLDEVLGRRFLDGRARELAGIARPDPLNRFMSGLPAHLLCRALGLGAGGFCLDSACSSSLYAIKLACDRLHDRRADLMLAGGVNRADDLFIHIGFCALQAMSRSGRSRPFHRRADGLLPAEGAAFVVLRRLEDALAAGDPILGVIRGIGLSNDGRGRGLLAPCAAGQERALRQAYAQSGLDPAQVAYVECHATGTPVGDVVEIESTSRVFSGVHDLPVGSLKANLGHLITASGAAGLLKVLAALRAGVLPPSIHAEEPFEELARSPLRLVTEQERWRGPRRAAVSNFGFGGNNAHLIVEAVETLDADPRRPGRRTSSLASDADVAVVALQAIVGDGRHRADFVRDLFAGATRLRPAEAPELEGGFAEEVELPALGLRFPPKDLDETLAQQLMVLKAALLAVEETGPLPGAETGVFIGMQCDAEVARYGARLRMPEWARRWGDALGIPLDEGWLAEARAGVGFLRKAAGVVGAMPNIPANRVNSQLDLGGPSFTVSAEELSGVVCFELAARALRRRELDAALVGAVDLCCEPVHVAAARQVLATEFPGEGRDLPGDATVVLVLKRLEDAQRDGDRVYAVLPAVPPDGAPVLRLGPSREAERLSLLPQFGHSHAACGLLHLAAAALACHHRASPVGPGRQAVPWWPVEGRRAARVEVAALGGASREVTLVEPPGGASPLLLGPVPRLQLYAGRDRAEVRQRLQRPDHQQAERGAGPARLVLLAAGEDQLAQRRERALELLATTSGSFCDEGVHFRERPLPGELALVFTGPAGVYPGMGRELLLGLPVLLQRLQSRCRHVERTAGWIYGASTTADELGPHEKLWGSSFLSQLHAELTLGLLGLKPQAAVGFCSGETNALFALGAWTDLDHFYGELLAEGVFSREIGGELDTVRRAWGLGEGEPTAWHNWRVLAPEAEVHQALAGERRCHMTIVSAPGDVVIGGEPEACQRVVARVGRSRAYPLGYDVAIHCPELESYAGRWRELHHRRTSAVPGVRFYTSASCSSYEATADAAADALLGMALRRVDFPAVVRRAYDDGVRIFVEHGPRDGCTKWIDQILGEREHLAVALDRGGRSPIEQAMHAVAQLVAAGVPVELEALQASLDGDGRPSRAVPTRSYPAHPAPLALPPLPPRGVAEHELQLMEPAPPLPSVLAVVEQPSGGRGPTVPASAEGRLAAGQARLADAHRAFLERQAQVHEAFLGFRARSLARLAEICQRDLPGVPPAFQQAVVEATTPAPVTGPTFSREQLAIHASGRISELFGPLFEQQDRHARQVRLPEPPLLLVDRVVGLDGEPGSMGTGTVWTETDVRWDAWYLHDGHVPAGIVVEAGQADLLLISWLGIDFHNQGERVYRLLGCELTNRGTLPRPGDTLRYAIHVDGHARAGDVRLFFFHYDCYVGDELRLQVRNAQAGFFTDEELAQSGGVLWEPETAEVRRDGPCDPPAVVCTRRRFTAEQVRAFSEGRAHECFGPGFERCLTHTRTPRIQPGRMRLLQEVTAFDPEGGPWGRGYLRVDNRVAPDDWTMQGHFKNDPCMPGTLMCEGCLQAMAFYIAAMGCTVERDGWRFEPVPDETYKLQCRGQVVPGSKHLTYEVFVEEFSAGPRPTIIADILGTCDGLKIFHGRRMGLRLVPDWPMNSMRPEQLRGFGVDHGDDRPVAELGGFRFDQRSLLACAWGRPSEAFGEMAQVFDGTRHIARLPGPPYHFMSRVTRIEGEMGSMRSGASIELEYDIPADAWYFRENGAPVMPYCVLLEAVLQPCGWLAVYIGCPGSADVDLYFRNLDGTGTVHAELTPAAGTLSTRTTLTSISKVGHVILVSFDVACRVGDQPVYTLKTSFGFFPAEALAAQVGLPVSEEQRARLTEPSEFSCDLTARPARYFDGTARLPDPMLLMLDRVTGYWPDGGRSGLGRLRAEKDVSPDEWFFRAHFFQDPVQPGSLGLEAMFQLLCFYMIHTGMPEASGIERPRFEPIALGRPFTWKYRGQVTPEKQRVTVEMELLERGRDHAVAEAWLWVDGLCIYHSPDVALRIVSGEAGASEPGTRSEPDEEVLDPEVDRWLLDHRPNWTLPTLPLMSMVDRLAAAAARRHPGLVVAAVQDVEITGWLILDGPRRLRTRVAETTPVPGPDGALELEVTLEAWREAATPALSRFETVARGRVILARGYPPPPAPLPHLEEGRAWPDPYAAGALFHGPAFQVLRRLEVGGTGSTAWLDAGGGSVPQGLLNQGLLDGAVHGILHDSLERWLDVPAKQIAYPFRLRRATFHGPTPRAGELRCEVRAAGFDDGERFPTFQIQLLAGERPWAVLQLVEVLIPMGPHADDRQKRIDFREGRFVEGAGLSRFDGPLTRLTDAEVRSRDWLRGSVAFAYKASSTDPEALTRELAVKDHLSQRARVHPATVRVVFEGEETGGSPAAMPLTRFPVTAVREGEEVVVADAGPPHLDLAALRAFGRRVIGLGAWLGEDLSLGLCRRFLRGLHLDDPEAFAQVTGRGALYLGNHQVQVESMLLPMAVTAATGVHVVTVAKEQHRTGWIGPLSSFTYSYPGVSYPRVIVYFDQSDPASMFGVLEALRGELTEQGHSVFVHVEGELALSCRRPVEKLSSVFLDLAQELGLPIVPVRLAGGLPVKPLPATADFPLGYTAQDYHLGRPIPPEELAKLPYAERRRHVLDALNRVGPPLDEERPNPPDPAFAERVAALRAERGLDEVRAVVLAILEELPRPSAQTSQLLAAVGAGRLVVSDDAEGRWLADAARWLLGEALTVELRSR